MWFLALPFLHPSTFFENVFNTCKLFIESVGTAISSTALLWRTLLHNVLHKPLEFVIFFIAARYMKNVLQLFWRCCDTLVEI